MVYPADRRLSEIAMKKTADNWTWQEISFPKWRSTVNRRLKEIYLITIDDAGIDDERLVSHWQMKQSPYEFVEWYAIKYDLDPKYAIGL
jgi:hypothetical protein